MSLLNLSRGCNLTVSNSAILSDVTTPETRAKALAHVGIAFAICFCIGPPIGAYFASRPLPPSFTASGFELNVYAGPAALTLGLLTLETIFLIFALPETRGKASQKPSANSSTKAAANGKANGSIQTSRQATVVDRLTMLKSLQRLHFLFLGVFSGVEFTLTFLTFDCECFNITLLAHRPVDKLPSVRLEQQAERRTDRFHWNCQCPPARRIRPARYVQGRRREYGPARDQQLRLGIGLPGYPS